MLQAGRGQTADSLAVECRVSRRTIFRDLEILRQAGVPLRFDDDRREHRIAGACLLPATNFTPQEALALVTLCRELGQSAGIPMYGAARSAAAKIESSLPAPLREEVREATRAVRIRREPVNPLDLSHDYYQQLLRAVTRRRAVRIEYRSLAEQKQLSTKLYPYQLFFNRRSWYIVGRSSWHRAVRTFHVGRISRVEILDEAFRVPRGFNIDRMVRNAWNLIPERGPDALVTVRFEPLVAQNVAEVLWHKNQRLEWRNDGRLDFHVQVSGIHEIAWWILGYGDQATVIRPERLRNLIADRARRMVERYAALGVEPDEVSA